VTRPYRKHSSIKSSQRGLVIVLFAILFSLISISLLLTFARARDSKVDRNQATQRALALAQETLISRAVKDTNRPGSLPCPDTDNDGDAESPIGHAQQPNCPSWIGRFPYKTLEAEDIRDGQGERLWYALSPGFQDTGSSTSPNYPTSEAVGALNVSGIATSSSIVAILFSPGPVLGKQQRDGANALSAVNYLEEENSDGSALPPAPDLQFASKPESNTFNDRLLVITVDTIMRPV
jgi:type II secretory pathway pseudopilin PulG